VVEWVTGKEYLGRKRKARSFCLFSMKK
jgi:hypothetical protein